MNIAAPSFEWLELSPVLIVFVGACLGVLLEAVLPRQFDEYCWFDQTRAVSLLDTARIAGMPETYPFGL